MIKGKQHTAQLIILFFLVLMIILAWYAGLSTSRLINDSLIRVFMNGVLVLSLLPMLNAGAGINYGLPVGIQAGLLGMCTAVNFGCQGLLGFTAALLLSAFFAVLFGYVYALILNHLKGREEIAGIFIGFSTVYLMCFFWATAPYSNPAMLWPIGGQGLRLTIGLQDYFFKVLNHLWVINIGHFILPLGMGLFFVCLCFLTYLFFKTKLGTAINAVGENPAFCKLSGINIDRTRTMAIILSTVLAALGICVYAQSFGFIELYEAPLMMAFPAASAILIGGSKGASTSILQVILGTFLFQSVYVYTGPVANTLLMPEVSEIVRVIMVNGIILYALIYAGRREQA
ncbi:MAG: ABC transporter permease subunit [Syntrophomonadaceae bacterium]|jgi:simple sugar transport system permease protein